MSARPSQKQNMAITADLMIQGATLLREPCPRCGGVQIKFQGRTLCTVEDDLSQALSGEKKPDSEGKETRQIIPELKKREENTQQKSNLEAILEGKLASASKQLETTTDLEEQTKLLDLISKYVETLSKLKKSS